LTNVGNEDAFIAKFDSAGTTLWAKSIGGAGHEIGTGVSCNIAGNIFAAGTFTTHLISIGTTNLTNASVSDTTDIFVLKYDASGNLIGGNDPKGDANDECHSICSDNFSNVFITGSSYSLSLNFDTCVFHSGYFENMFTAKLGSSFLGVKENTDDNTITIYPNPLTSTTTITFSEEQKNTSIKVMDVLGQCVLQSPPLRGCREGLLDMAGYAKGIYFVRIEDEKKNVVMRKVVKQ
jgi:hypothetical protein